MNSMLNTENIAKNTNNMEFGSDFHLCAYPIGKSILDIYQNANLYIDGRQALIDIVKQNQWERIWVPSYYCYEFVESIRPYIEVKYYNYTPFEDLNQALDKITISDKEAIVISNFFGLNDQSHNYLKGTVIEDHSHDLISDWARNSNADWCFASLRKTLPVADGGILWSPKHYNLPRQPRHTEAGDKLADDRYRAMALKSQYLEVIKKDKYCLYLKNKLSKYVFFKTKSEPKYKHVIVREKWNVIENQVIAVGFSAGGHLVTSVSGVHDELREMTGDLSHINGRPNAVIGGYPMIDLKCKDFGITCDKIFLGENYSEELSHNLSVQNLIDENYPPMFLFSMKYDPTVPPETNCLVAEKVMNEKGVPNEVHIYRGNVHGFGLADGLEAGQWVNQSIEFLKKNSVI